MLADGPTNVCALTSVVGCMFILRGAYVVVFFIRAKRVSNCYMQEKKTDRLSVCLSGCSDNLLVLVGKNCLGFSVGYERAPGWF